MNKILIKNGKIINFDSIQNADILIENGKIIKIAQNLQSTDSQIINADGKYIFPGGIDPHVHLHLPTANGFSTDDFETGTLAALKGGTTTIIDFVTPRKGQSLVDAFLERRKEAENAKINVRFHVSPIEWTNSTADEMRQLVENHGVKSFKIYTAYKNSIGIDDDVIVKVLETAKKLGALVTVHCENDEIITYLRQKFISEGKTDVKYHPLSRPAEAEIVAIHKMLMLAKIVDTQLYIVHVSTKRGIEYIKNAQQKGVKVCAETCPHYLLLTDDVYDQDFDNAAKYVLSPPIRKAKDNRALWQGIADGFVQTIGTDHCPFNLKGQKDIGRNDFTKIANGAGSIEHRLKLLYTYGVAENKISLQKFVEVTSTNAAKIFGIENKGELCEGFDADLYIFDPHHTSTISAKTHYQNCDSDIYEGFTVKGNIDTVIINGQIKFFQE